MGSWGVHPLALFPTDQGHLQGCGSLAFLLPGVASWSFLQPQRPWGGEWKGLQGDLCILEEGYGHTGSVPPQQRLAKKTWQRAQKCVHTVHCWVRLELGGAGCSLKGAETNAGKGLGLAKHTQFILPKLTKLGSHCISSGRGEEKRQREALPYSQEK